MVEMPSLKTWMYRQFCFTGIVEGDVFQASRRFKIYCGATDVHFGQGWGVLYIIEAREGLLFRVMVSCHAYIVYTCGGDSVNENSLISGPGHWWINLNLLLIIAAS